MRTDALLSLTAPFLVALPEPARSGAPPPPDLEAALAEALREARLAWPELDMPAEAFVAYLAGRFGAAPPTAAALRALHAADLYLVCACARRDPRAIAAFEARHFPSVDRVLARMKIDPLVAGDAKGALRERLFFLNDDEGGQRLLSGYSGRGEVGAWLRSVAVRAALKAGRSGRGAPTLDEALNVALPGGDPEAAYLKATFAAAFKAALDEALGALSPRERTLLRQHVIDGLTVTELGALYKVHRATAARWVADVRAQLLKDVQTKLMARLRLNKDELESAMRLAQSQLDVSIRRLLQPKKGKG